MRPIRFTPAFAFAVLALVAIAFSAVPSSAQDATGDVAISVMVETLPGHGPAFEEGMKEHMAALTGMGDTSTWMVFEIAAGERTGQYMVASFSHTWDFFDQPPTVDQEEAQASMQANIVPHVQGVQTQWMVRRSDLGQWTAATPVAPMYEVITFEVRGNMNPTFANVLAKLKHANEEMGVDGGYSVFRPRVGGTGNQWVLSVPHQNFAGFGEGEEDWMEQLLVQVYGPVEMQSIMDDLDDAIVSAKSELFVVRRDLSMNMPSS